MVESKFLSQLYTKMPLSTLCDSAVEEFNQRGVSEYESQMQVKSGLSATKTSKKIS